MTKTTKKLTRTPLEFQGYTVNWGDEVFLRLNGDEVVDEVHFQSPDGQRLMQALLASGRTISCDLTGMWVCRCGNTPSADGFDPCDRQGRVVPATFASSETMPWVCQRCGRIFHPLTLEIVGQRG
ncbi:MAG: hypothetical protein M3Q71_20350 [Chloroflexota bacterium]|nr:hypothetical protein [Chloroflexota bacterium]MDP9472982.1 hypothetical protein [Chloroflexota bacterium]